MNVKKAIMNAATYLRLDQVVSELDSSEEITDESTLATIDRLVRLANVALLEISREYLPLKTRAAVTISESGLSYATLPYRLNQVYSLENESGVSVPVRLYADHLTVPKAGEYYIEYSFLPPIVTINSQINYAGLDENMLAYAIASEYSLVMGETADAINFDRRFKDALSQRATDKKEKRWKRRAWL